MTHRTGTASSTGAERHGLELEELCLEFESRWRPDAPEAARIEEFLARAPATLRAGLVEELVAVECELREAAGQMPDREEYLQRFPQWRDAIDLAFAWRLADNVRPPADRKAEPPEKLGDYRIVREIGRGGMGVVYEAVQESLGRRVAIKTLVAHPLHQPTLIKRFQREIRAIGALHHTNIVDVYGSGEQDGTHYYTMQLVQGNSLSQLIAAAKTRDGRSTYKGLPRPSSISPADTTASEGHRTRHRDAALIGLQVARALEYAHRQGVLHRDIKPSNLLVDADGTALVTDFGLAKLHQEEGDATRTGDVVGTMRYLPPEAVNGQWDERGDVYSLGATLYEFVTLQPVFGGPDRTALLNQIAHGEVVRPRYIDPEVPRDLDTIVMKALAREPAARYQSAGEMADDLRRLIDGEPIVARRASVPERLWKWSRRKPALAALVAIVTLVAVVGIPTLAALWVRSEMALATAELERSKTETAREDAEAVGYGSSMQLAQFYVQQRIAAEAEPLLEQWIPGDSELSNASAGAVLGSTVATRDHRGWEWNYLKQQLDCSLMTLSGHSGAVHFVAIRPDDAQIATVGGSDPRQTPVPGEVILWDAKTGQQQHVLRGHASGVMGAAYSPDGTRLATISIKKQEKTGGTVQGSIKLWDPNSGLLLCTIEQEGWHPRNLIVVYYKPILPGVQFSADGRWLVSWPEPVEVREAETGELVWKAIGRNATLLPGGTQLAVLQDAQSVVVHELATGKEVKRLHIEAPGQPYDFATSNDQTRLSAMIRGDRIRLWSLPSWDQLQEIPTPDIHWGAISPAGDQLVYGDRRGVLHFRPLDETQPEATLMGHRGSIGHAAFSHDGRWLVTASQDGTARVWSMDVARRPRVADTGIRTDSMGDMAFGNDGTRVLYASSRSNPNANGRAGWRAVDGESAREQQLEITHYTHWPRTDFAFSADGRLFAAPAREPEFPDHRIGYARSGKVNIWASETLELLQTLNLEAADLGSAEITSVAWSRDATQLAVASFDTQSSEIRVFQVAGSLREPPATCHTIDVDGHHVTALSFDPTGSRLVASTSSGITIWKNWRDEPQREHYLPHAASAAFLDYSPTGDRLVAAYQEERLVRVYDTRTGVLAYDSAAPRSVSCVRFSPNGRRLAMVGYDSLIHYCDAETGYRLLTLSGSKSAVGTISFTPRVAFSPDGRRLATNDWEGRITVWEAEAGGTNQTRKIQ